MKLFEFKSHLYGIEITNTSRWLVPSSSLNRTFMELESNKIA